MKRLKAGIPAQCCTLNISGKAQERLISMFKAMGNPVRFEIIKFLSLTPAASPGTLSSICPSPRPPCPSI